MIGDLGKVYGHQWRRRERVYNDEMPPGFENKIETTDQIKNIIDGLKTNPYSRYHILDAWNPSDFKDMALPPCHLLYQFIVRPLSLDERRNILHYSGDFTDIYNDTVESMDALDVPKFYLNLNMYQRSCDTFLGVPFNIASMSLLLMIIAKACNMIPRTSKWIGGDIHLYLDHIPVAKEQIDRIPKTLPQMVIKKDINTLSDIVALTIDDFELINYESDDKLFGELHTGYEKIKNKKN
jgi:thymidylate synthase